MRKRLIIAAIAVVALVGAGFGGHFAYLWLTRNDAASCANCRSFIHWQLDEYAAQHDGWYPKGGNDPLDSLARGVEGIRDVHLFTSHAQAQQLATYWESHKTFTSNLCCYSYVEGLRTSDPDGLVMLYYWKPTRWECSSHKMKEEGRPVCLTPPGHSWEFIPEAKFQEMLAQTLAYLRGQGRTFTEGRSYYQTVQRPGASRSTEAANRAPSATDSRR